MWEKSICLGESLRRVTQRAEVEAAILRVGVATLHRLLGINLTRIMAHLTAAIHLPTLPQLLTLLQNRHMLLLQLLTLRQKRPILPRRRLTLHQLLLTPLQTPILPLTQPLRQLTSHRTHTLLRTQLTSHRTQEHRLQRQHLPTRPRLPSRRRLCTTQQPIVLTRIPLPIPTPITTRQQQRLIHLCTLTTGLLTTTLRTVTTLIHT